MLFVEDSRTSIHPWTSEHPRDEVTQTRSHDTTHRLRLKIRVPYQSLQTHVSRLHKLQQASDVLRRTSRFVVLARRLQSQMAEIQNDDRKDGKEGQTSPTVANVMSFGQGQELEDEKERTIAKAALSIAELGVPLTPSYDPSKIVMLICLP